MDASRRQILERQGYRIVGNHSAVKLCHWLKSEIAGGPGCYKESFYGIRSHRCLQMTPTADACNLNCLFCWRAQDWGSDRLSMIDEPRTIVDEAIGAQRVLISGFKGDSRVGSEIFLESSHPNQVAISLTGEPTLYRRLGELIHEFKRRDMTTFLVTNGTTPTVLEDLDPLPTQLYVTIAAPNKAVFGKLSAPRSDRPWANIMRTLELLPSLDTRTVIRHTLVEGWNLGYEQDYARLDSLASPDFVECKAYMFVGRSRQRLNMENMPSHAAIREFSKGLAREMSYYVADERPDSRVVLITHDGKLDPL